MPSPAEIAPFSDLYNAGRYIELETRALLLVIQYPDFGFGWKLLGIALQMQGKNALPAFKKAAEFMPDDAEVHNNLGTALYEHGLYDDALKCFRRAMELKPDSAESHYNLGKILQEIGNFDEAVTSYRKAVKLQPDYAMAYYNLGNALKDSGKLDEAVQIYRQAVAIKPDFAEAHYNLGLTLKALGKFEGAAKSYRQALEIESDFFETYIYLGIALKDIGQFDAALSSFCKAVVLKPNSAEVHNNLGMVRQTIGQLDDAVGSYRQALEINPEFALVYSNLLFALNYTNQAPQYYLEEAQKYGRMADKKVTSRFSAWQCADQPKRLRVGMVSGDLHNHPVGYFLKSLLAQLDPTRIELIAYPTDTQVDALTIRIKPYFAAWKPLFGLSDEAAARLIHADGVHVLIDLSGHTENNRLPIFAWKPAPVQASWLGYFATTGVTGMDFLLADEMGVPKKQREHYTETIWYFPDTRLCFTAPETELPVAPLPALQNGYITFGCFQNLSKVGNEVLTAWGEILSAVPGAKLRWQCKQLGDPAVAAQLVERLQQHGINPARVSLHGTMPRDAYLSAHAAVDLILDTFPYPGGTTTCEALWMGVPTLTLAGDTLLARQGASLLTAAGLEDWVATSMADYIEMAVGLSDDLPKLAALRAGLRKQVSASPLFDAQRFARNFEDALWGMWQARTQRLRMSHELPAQT